MFMQLAKKLSPTPERPAPERVPYEATKWGLMFLLGCGFWWLYTIDVVPKEIAMVGWCLIARSVRQYVAIFAPEVRGFERRGAVMRMATTAADGSDAGAGSAGTSQGGRGVKRQERKAVVRGQ